MKFSLEDAIIMLERTPRVLREMLATASDAWVRANYGLNTFSPFDVVGHLIHGEKTDWMPRLRIILQFGESRPFEPFDRYAMYEASKGKTTADLLAKFERLRAGNLAELRAMKLDQRQLSLPGTHPALGRVTLEELLATWVVHDLNHVAQIAKAMAYQYKEAVGPWHGYLSILRPPVS
jgi:hypothetical protein